MRDFVQLNVVTQRGFVPVDDHMQVVDADGALVIRILFSLFSIFVYDSLEINAPLFQDGFEYGAISFLNDWIFYLLFRFRICIALGMQMGK